MLPIDTPYLATGYSPRADHQIIFRSKQFFDYQYNKQLILSFSSQNHNAQQALMKVRFEKQIIKNENMLA